MATRRPRARRPRTLAGALAPALALLLLAPAGARAVDEPRHVGQVTDTLRTPAHRLAAGSDGRALADLVFLDREQDDTTYRTCVRRGGRKPVRTCFSSATGAAGSAVITPLRFQRGRYAVSWTVAGAVVARWQFSVV